MGTVRTSTALIPRTTTAATTTATATDTDTDTSAGGVAAVVVATQLVTQRGVEEVRMIVGGDQFGPDQTTEGVKDLLQPVAPTIICKQGHRAVTAALLTH